MCSTIAKVLYTRTRQKRSARLSLPQQEGTASNRARCEKLHLFNILASIQKKLSYTNAMTTTIPANECAVALTGASRLAKQVQGALRRRALQQKRWFLFNKLKEARLWRTQRAISTQVYAI